MRYTEGMLGKLFLLFTLVPALELYLLIQIGERLGAVATVALIVLTGTLGAGLARAEGLRVLRDWQTSLAAGKVPTDGVVSSALVLIGGVLLITPGVLTDCVGLLLLLPAVRRPVARALMRKLERSIADGTIHVVRSQRGPAGPFAAAPGAPPTERKEIITVEGETVGEDARAVLPRREASEPDGRGQS